MSAHTYNTGLPVTMDPAAVPRTAGGTIASGIVQVIVDDSYSKADIIRALEAVENKLATSTWPPTGA